MAEVEGPQAALAEVDDLNLGQYHLFQATRARLLDRLRRHAEAVAAYEAALVLATNGAERTLLTQRLDHVRSGAVVED